MLTSAEMYIYYVRAESALKRKQKQSAKIIQDSQF